MGGACNRLRLGMGATVGSNKDSRTNFLFGDAEVPSM